MEIQMKEKKGSLIPALVIVILAIIAAAGVRTFAGPCVHEDGSFGPCHWAGQALLGLGCVIGILAILSLCVQKARLGTYMSALPVCGLGILTPGTLIDLCHMSTMRCRMVMQPAMILLFSAALLCALTGAIFTARK